MCGYPGFPTPFIEETVLSPLCVLDTLVFVVVVVVD